MIKNIILNLFKATIPGNFLFSNKYKYLYLLSNENVSGTLLEKTINVFFDLRIFIIVVIGVVILINILNSFI